MQESKWVKCPRCGHKLFKDRGRANVEIKCSSCKSVITVLDGITVKCVETRRKNGENKEEKSVR